VTKGEIHGADDFDRTDVLATQAASIGGGSHSKFLMYVPNGRGLNLNNVLVLIEKVRYCISGIHARIPFYNRIQ
jgi:hypothetical protein